MKRIKRLLTGLAALLCAAACGDTDAQFITFIPTHPLHDLVTAAEATIGGETVSATIDNDAHTVIFYFVTASDYSKVHVKMTYSKRAKQVSGTFDEMDLDLTEPYTMVLNNLEEDFTYTLSAARATSIQVNRLQCSIVEGLPGDAILVDGCKDLLFDGKWMEKKEDYAVLDWKYFGWQMDAEMPAGHGNAFTFDVGEVMRLEKVRLWPYWPYCNNTPAIWEVYAFSGTGDPVGDWESWIKIGECDDTGKWEITRDADPGSRDDMTQYGSTLEFDPATTPPARYYRLKMVQNFYSAFGGSMNEFWYVRVNWFTVSELEIWRYNG